MNELHILLVVCVMTALFFMPYAVTNILIKGLPRALGNPRPDDKPLPAWAMRNKAAHANAVENLVVFAPIVLAAHTLGATDQSTLSAAFIYFVARAIHYVVYTLGLPAIRTLSYFAGWGAMVYIGLRAIGFI